MKYRILFMFLVALVVSLAYYPTQVALEWVRNHDWVAVMITAACVVTLSTIIGAGLWESSKNFARHWEEKP